jgi:hypothetical protein
MNKTNAQKQVTLQQGRQTKSLWQRPLDFPKKVTIPLILLVLYLGVSFAPGMKFLQFPYYTIYCGHRPIVATNFAGGRQYYLPNDEGYQVNYLMNEYFCNESDAKAAFYYRY